jgi:hypothetical protein
MHGTALMLSALSLQEIGLLIEALALELQRRTGRSSNPTRDKFKLQKAVG